MKDRFEEKPKAQYANTKEQRRSFTRRLTLITTALPLYVKHICPKKEQGCISGQDC